MILTSFAFWGFFVVVFAIYYFVARSCRWQNILLLVASYYFYGVAEWRMLPLLVAATAIFYGLGIAIERANEKNERLASRLTTLGVVVGVGVLVYFKYLGFCIDSFASLFRSLGFDVGSYTLHTMMPLGISFFTFKLLGYLIEVHRGRIEAEHNVVDFALFVAFFPTILSGPIDRPQKFLPQLKAARRMDGDVAIAASKQIVWGLFLKLCIADRMAIYINAIMNNVEHHNGLSTLIAVMFYPLQMYADFCGYSDMAIGVALLLGLKVAENFKYPFFGRNIAEFWRGWHMSLTSWLTDYVFMPLNVAMRNISIVGTCIAIVVTFVLCGLWHGAGWSYALWGFYHGLLFVPLMISGAFMKKKKLKLNAHHLPCLKDIGKMLLTYLLVAIGLILFRAEGASDIALVCSRLVSPWGAPFVDVTTIGFMLIGLTALFFHDVNGAWKTFPWIGKVPSLVWMTLGLVALLMMGVFDGSQFIYFQF